MAENSKMVFNSIAVTRRNSFKMIDLFAGCGGLSIDLEKRWKSNTIRVQKDKNQKLWEDNSCLNGVGDLFLPNWEEELHGINYGEKYSIGVDLNQYSRIGKFDMVRDIVRYFRSMGFPVKRDFVGRIEIWIPTDEGNSTMYNRYTLNPKYKDLTDGWQIDVSHSGETRVSKMNVYDYQLDDHGYDVIVGTEVVRRKNLLQHHMHQYNGGHPIVNKYTKGILSLSEPRKMDRNKYATKIKQITGFIQGFLMTPAFQDALDINIENGGNLIFVRKDDIWNVDDKARNLKYGDGFVGSLPRTEFAIHGPYRMPEPHKYFFVSLKSTKSGNAQRRLYNIFTHGRDTTRFKDNDTEYGTGNSYKRMAEFISQPPTWEPNLSLSYNNYDTALYELEQHLSSNRFVPDYHYIAIIISEIHKDSTDPKLHELYYRMKELLMKYNITSQVIYANNIDNRSFSYFLPNIAAALVGKQNGMAWGLDSLSKSNDMIVGIGASKQKGRKPYLGTAFCFDKEGQFREFDCCQAEDTEALGASLQKALWQFCKQYGTPDRLIIHYYKKLRRDEGERIENMLKQNGLDCPVFIVNMVTAVNDDLIAFDTSKGDFMPVSGTYVNLRYTQYLLYNNERYSDYSKSDILYPIKLTITSANTKTPHELQPQDEEDIIGQVYQFCRLYWKSVKMQNVPITIAYPELVAEYVPHFPDEDLPDFGKHNLWML